MRVAISYSTEIENVPKEVERLLMFVPRTDVHQTITTISDLVSKNDCLNAIKTIDELRKQLGNLDYTLRDCSSILTGYVNTVTNQEATNESETDEG